MPALSASHRIAGEFDKPLDRAYELVPRALQEPVWIASCQVK